LSQLVSDLAQWIVEAVYYFGYPGVAFLMMLSNLQLIPSQLVLPLAGYLVGEGRFSFPLVLMASTAGAVAGALILYASGYWLGEERIRRFIKRFGRFVAVGESDLDKASQWFDRHGGEAVLISRLVPGVGNLSSVPAGIEQMSVWRFVVLTALGNGLWNSGLISVGWALGVQWPLVKQYAPIIEYAVLAAIAGGILWFLWRRWKTYR
jgi:membrane protein DedA with SNARE-associated domain